MTGSQALIHYLGSRVAPMPVSEALTLLGDRPRAETGVFVAIAMGQVEIVVLGDGTEALRLV